MVMKAIEGYVTEAKLKLLEAGYPTEIDEITICNRSSRACGRARVRAFDEWKQVIISSKIYKHDSPSLRDTVLHEVAHIADYTYNGRFTGHGARWAKFARIVGATPEQYTGKDELKMHGHESVRRKMRKHKLVCENTSCGNQYFLSPKLYGQHVGSNFKWVRCSKCQSTLLDTKQIVKR